VGSRRVYGDADSGFDRIELLALYPGRVTTEEIEPDGDGLAIVDFAGRDDSGPDDRGPRSPRRLWWYVGATATLAVVAMVVGIVVFNRSASDTRRGARTSPEAADQYVTAINAGDGRSAAGISCDAFADRARAAARSGKVGVTYSLDAIRATGSTTATAMITARLRVGGQQQARPADVRIVRTRGLWLMCGPAA
jgi:hypothetical protein